MNIYLILLVVFAVLVLIACMNNGFHQGFAHEFSSLISLILSVWVMMLLAKTAGLLGPSGKTGGIACTIILVLTGAVYKVIRVFLSSIKLLSRLPIICWLDSVLGMLLGLLIGFGILYILEYAARRFLLS